MEERPEVEEGSQPKQSEADSPIPLGGLPSSLVQSRRPPTPPLKTKPTRQQFTFASKTRLSDGGFYAPLSHPPEISPTSLLSLERYHTLILNSEIVKTKRKEHRCLNYRGAASIGRHQQRQSSGATRRSMHAHDVTSFGKSENAPRRSDKLKQTKTILLKESARSPERHRR
ncbi:hypothetical protein L218DRAFT_962288, partial [Marasmius fiardii PR-910]